MATADTEDLAHDAPEMCNGPPTCFVRSSFTLIYCSLSTVLLFVVRMEVKSASVLGFEGDWSGICLRSYMK